MKDAKEAAEALRTAAALNMEDPLREGCLLKFPDYGQVVMTGDMHGHRRNFQKLQYFCQLEQFGARHVMLHELIHEDVQTLDAVDTSHELLTEAARWKCAFPDQIHFLLSNHELAQVTGHEISKNGRIVTRDFERGVEESYGAGALKVLEGVEAFIRSFPLAGRTPNRVFLSHSLPSPLQVPSFDPAVLGRKMNRIDLGERGSAHMMVWGRYHTEPALKALSDVLDVDFFICGHQPQESGYEVLHDRMIILASEHNHGVFLPLDLSKPVTLSKLTANIRPFAGVADA